MSIRHAFLLFGSVMLIIAAMPPSFAQENAITIPVLEGNPPVIDGVWTGPNEWSQASATFTNYADETQLVIKAKHDWDSLYVLLEMPDDNELDGHGVVCLDTLNDGGPYMKADDYCFTLGGSLRVYQGDGRTTVMSDQVAVSREVQAARGLTTNSPPGSGEHMSYEFKIPLEEFGPVATDYGLYINFDTRGQASSFTYHYSWPDLESDSYLNAPPPRSWGQISLSPDANAPEFSVPVMGAIAGAVGLMTILTRTALFKKLDQQ
jgi:hypothetical protein